MERRKENDFVVMSIRTLSVISWLLFLLTLILFHYARPELEYGIMRYFDIAVREHWLVTPKNIMNAMLVLSTMVSVATLYLKRIRTKRTSDSIGVNQISVLLICVFFLLVINL